MKDLKKEIINIIFVGKIKNDDMSNVIEILSIGAKEIPNFMLEKIKESIEMKMDTMAPTTFAILLCKCDNIFLNKTSNIKNILTILDNFNLLKLLELTEILKSKIFEKGLGSKFQNWIKSSIELWSVEKIKKYYKENKKEFIAITKIIHPKFSSQKNNLIKELKNNKKNSLH